MPDYEQAQTAVRQTGCRVEPRPTYRFATNICRVQTGQRNAN